MMGGLFVLVSVLPTGERLPAIQPIFPQVEGRWGASTFGSPERAEYFAKILRAWGETKPLEIAPLHELAGQAGGAP